MLRPCAFLEVGTLCAGIFYFGPSHRQINHEHTHNAAFGDDVHQPVSVARWSSHDFENGTPRQSYRYAPAINHVERQSRALQLESSTS